MSTSLADQLRRLKAPQTSTLVDSTKRASILFESAEAANKDRETIFEIGASGLNDLIALSPSFSQFEATLFNKNSLELQRAVESSEVNKHLNKTIKKFMVHLTPYLLLTPAHQCLEWLIRRFKIHAYNKDELMMLILPYHETRIFVKCVQVMQLKDQSDKWHWLNKIQKPGVPLSKQALLNRAASDKYFLKFVCESTTYAFQELESKSNTLQVYYAFFCTTVIGALEVARISDAHISNIYSALHIGLKSNSVDFCAASFMIIGQLVSKVKLSAKILDKMIQNVVNFRHSALRNDAIILLVLIYTTQEEMLKEIPEEAFYQLIHSKWIPSALAQIYSDKINILPFFLRLLSQCLKDVQSKSPSAKASQKMCESLLKECFFKPEEAKDVIR